MADKNNPFGSYSERNAGRTVQNVTSSMWEPISTGSSVSEYTPVRKSPSQPKKASSAKKNNAGKAEGSQKRKASGFDVGEDRISDGGRKATAPSAEKKKKSTASPKKKTQKKDKKPVGSKSREPKGRDTRNIESRENKARIQKEKKRARNRARSREKVKKQSRQGVSYDEMRKKTSRSKRLKAKIIAAATVLITLAVVACCVCAYAYSKGAPVSVINIVGESRYKNEKILEKANLYVGINMLSVREKTVNDAVTGALPYIKDVQVDYQFPDTLVLNVTPTQEKYLISNGTGFICLDANGKVLSLNKKKLTDGRYLAEGFEEQAAETGKAYVPTENNLPKYEKVKEIVAVLEKSGRFTKGVIDVTDLGNVNVIYDSRINIYLGSCDKLESQLEFAMNIIEKDQDIINGQTGYIETRYEGQATFKPGSMKK